MVKGCTERINTPSLTDYIIPIIPADELIQHLMNKYFSIQMLGSKNL